MAERSREQQAVFEAAIRAVAEQETLSTGQLDALSALDGADVETFRAVWATLPAGARARAIRALHQAATERLRLEFAPLNRLALDDPDPNVRLAGVQGALEDRGSALLERLLRLLESDPVGAVRRAAAEDLSRFVLLAELEDLDRDVARRVRAALEGALERADEEPGVRSAALAALGYLSDEATAERIAAAFGQRDLRAGAIRAMGRSADPRWTERLLPVLGSEDADLRLEAARALGEIEDERAVGPLGDLVDDPERGVRLATIEALRAIGGEEAREALLYLLEDRDSAVREAADAALADMEEDEELGL